VKISDCTRATSRPKAVTLACADGNALLDQLDWSSFGGHSAAARGRLVINTCQPDCAQGRDVSYQVSVRASDPRNCKGALRVYGEVTLRFDGRAPKPADDLSHWTLGCPL
jgi:hypothetical protein